MTVQRMDNVAVVVPDLDEAIAFFSELGLRLETRMQIEGQFADQAVGLDGIRSEIAMMATPDGRGRLELTMYHAPAALEPEPAAPNTVGFHRVMFAVDDIDDTVSRLGSLGGEVLGEIAQYENVYRLCYLRAPAGFVIGLAEEIG
jgi:catechol 2,3-dioxygenase-like lactoylglutathione lyase family enzyme